MFPIFSQASASYALAMVWAVALCVLAENSVGAKAECIIEQSAGRIQTHNAKAKIRREAHVSAVLTHTHCLLYLNWMRR